jgi:hypothetical protein
MPVAGPTRWQSTITVGISAMLESPSISVMRESPGPLVAVIDGTPPKLAPITMPRAAISSSACTTRPPAGGSSSIRVSMISDDGVMG